ncbi:MAG: bacterio-opsin activator domain-containing protein [Halobacteriaceae archaeon]
MATTDGRAADRAILEHFERVPGDPLTAEAVADATDISTRTVRERLASLVERDRLATKSVTDADRVWWFDAPGPTLTGERALELTYRSPSLERYYTDQGLAEGHVDIDTVVERSDGTELLYITALGIPSDDLVWIFRALPQMDDVRLLSTDGAETRVEVVLTEETVASTFRAFDGELQSAALVDGRFRLVGTVPASVDPAAVSADLEEVLDAVSLVDERLVYTPWLFREVVADRLTERQASVVEAAYYAGYYGHPRESTGAEVAASLDITRQTFHHHRRRAEERVFAGLFESTAREV